MPALSPLPLIVALLQPAPASSQVPQAPPTPPPLVSPAPQQSPASPAPTAAASGAPTFTPTPAPAGVPAPAPTVSPTPPSPTPSPGASPVASPIPYTYIVMPTPGPSAGPQIVQVALNDHVLHKGGPLFVRITTTVDVTAVVARALGHQIGIAQIAPGVFSGAQQLPDGIPFFMLGRNYTVDFIATTADGRSCTTSLEIRLER